MKKKAKVWEMVSDGRRRDAEFLLWRLDQAQSKLDGITVEDNIVAGCQMVADGLVDTGYGIEHAMVMISEMMVPDGGLDYTWCMDN